MRAVTEWIPVGVRDIWEATSDDECPTAPVVDRIEANVTSEMAFPTARAALVAALTDAGLNADDEVVLPAYTCHALVSAVEAVATPRFVDIEPTSFTMDLDALAAVAPTAVAVVPVHLFGALVDMSRIREIAEQHDLVVIEDAAQALGAAVSTSTVGSHSDYCVFSFRFSKEVTTHKGGLLVGSDIGPLTPTSPDYTAIPRLAATKVADGALGVIPGRVYEQLRRQVLDPFFTSTAAVIGETAPRPLTPAQRRLLDRQLAELADRVQTRRDHARRYAMNLEGPIQMPVDSPNHTYFRYPVLVPPEQRANICRALRRKGVGVSTMYDYTVAPEGEADIAERVAASVVNLPVHAGLDTSTVERISTVFNRVIKRHG
ncbi:DegT/DnrJ/EryC1/StrS family aminotransferase [Halobacterium bonnevillei]|uniref:DegT/DnrJ/EryC1/StrS family aminotransferase n=1 Tax=Halobacterium bonnevillei TaxID=2692200 RepID=A0A6B0SHX0_9EURY|nr:DegT/DnrJ/EryC1/StrS family aminotransferase [Halobacterium bonnevillei]MXR19471.1 hypothetical protein [Halobacterium bonnevillei]